MKNISKIIVSIIIFMLISCISISVFADNDTLDLSNSLIGGNSTTGNNTTDNNTVDNNTIDNNTTGDNTTNNTVQDLTPSTTNTNSNTTNNTSTYEETDIPYAGPEDTILMVTAFVVCAIIGIYTFMKLSDYSNI